jgi:hypothetical protein
MPVPGSQSDLIQVPIILSGATDALTFPGLSIITTAGADATTLGTPVAGSPSAGGMDGISIWVISTTANAHTVTTAANKINTSFHIATFGAVAGNMLLLVASNGVWFVEASKGITLS